MLLFRDLARIPEGSVGLVFVHRKQKRDSREGVRGVSKIEKEGEQRYLLAQLGVFLAPCFCSCFCF